jgi:hypothetical protein
MSRQKNDIKNNHRKCGKRVWARLKWLRIRKVAIYRYSKENLERNWTVSNFKMYTYDRTSQIHFQLVEIQITSIWKWVCGYWLGSGLESRVSIPSISKRFLSSLDRPDRLQWPTHLHIQWVPWTFSWGKKRSVFEINHLAQSSVKVKNKCIYTSTTSLRLNGAYRDNFTLYS